MADIEEDNSTEVEDESEELLLQQQEEETKKRLINNYKKRLDKIISRLTTTKSNKLSFVDKTVIKLSKPYPELKKKRQTIDKLITFNTTAKQLRTTTMSSVGSVGLGAIAIVIGVILLIAIIIMITPKWLLEMILGIKIDDPELEGVDVGFGITGKDFYGARVVYEDDEKATVSIIEDYVDLVSDGVSEAQTITTITKDNVELDIDVTVNIPIPNEEYSYEQFDETTFASEYATLYAIVGEIAKEMYKTDNQTEYAGSSVVECVEEIKYFGYGKTAINTISTKVKDKILENTTFVVDYPEPEEGETLPTVEKTDVDNLITNKLTTLYTNEKYNNRAEKLFIKDVILEGDKKVSGLTQQKYHAFIFMPNKNVQFDSLSFTVGGAKLTNYEITLSNNGTQIELENDGSNLGGDTADLFVYVSNNNLNVTATKFEDIDESNLSALSNGLSLFEIINNLDYNFYLKQSSTDADGTNYLTYKDNGMVAKMTNGENGDAFSFAERETVWQAAP